MYLFARPLFPLFSNFINTVCRHPNCLPLRSPPPCPLPPAAVLLFPDKPCFSAVEKAATDFIDIPTDINVWATDKPTLSIGKKPVWCHTNCVHFSPQTKYDEAHMTWLYVGGVSDRRKHTQHAKKLDCL